MSQNKEGINKALAKVEKRIAELQAKAQTKKQISDQEVNEFRQLRQKRTKLQQALRRAACSP